MQSLANVSCSFLAAVAMVHSLAACSKSKSKPEASTAERAASMTELYGLKKVPTFDIELSEADIESLRAEPKEWIKGGFAYGEERYDKVSIRIKGNRSLRSIDEKPALKLRFNKGEKYKDRRFLGVHQLTLNNLVEDPTMIREYLSYRLAREVGLPVPKAGFANLRVNGEEYGLYLVVETPDENFLERQFGNGQGELYEGEYGCDVTEDDVDGFDLDSGSEDRSALARFAKAASGTGEELASELWRGEGAPVTLEHLSLFLAFSAYVGDFDGYHHSHNYRIYRNPTDDKWQFMSWGLDRSWFKDLPPYSSRGHLATKCFSHLECRKAYLLAMRRVHAAAEKLDLSTGAKVISSIISDDVNADTRRPYKANTVMKRRKRLMEFLADRGRYVAEHTACLDADGNELDRDGDGFGCMDCDDGNADVHPGASESCDGIDNDCSGLVDEAAICPCPEHDIDGARYAFCNLPMPHADAARQCVDRGGALASFESLTPLATIRELANEVDEDRWWLGGSDRKSEGSFVWMDGSPVGETLWARGEPDNTGCNQDCIVLPKTKKGKQPKLHDTHCGQHRPFLCALPPQNRP